MHGEALGPEHEIAITALETDPRVYPTLLGTSRPPRAAEIRARLTDMRRHWDRHGFGLWLWRERATGELAGRGGLQYTDVIGGLAVEAAWAIMPERWGQGFASELAGAAVSVAFDTLGLDEVIALTLEYNIASRRVMEKAGFAYVREIGHAGLPHVLYTRVAGRAPGPLLGSASPRRRPL